MNRSGKISRVKNIANKKYLGKVSQYWSRGMTNEDTPDTEPSVDEQEGSGDTDVPELVVGLTEKQIAEWKECEADHVRNKLFSKKQFLVRDAELDMGGIIQKIIAKELNLVDDDARMKSFWNKCGGRETVRNTFRKKRQAAQNGMKLAFKGKTMSNEELWRADSWFSNHHCFLVCISL
jgi:hypothetical protein